MAKVNFSKLAGKNSQKAIDINWEVYLPAKGLISGEASEYIKVHTTSSNLPKQEIKFDTLNIKGVKSRQVTNIDREGDISMEVAESDTYLVQQWLENVATSYVDPETRNIANKKDYQIDEGIEIVLTDGEGNPQKTYKLKYCTIEAPEPQEISTGDGAIAKVKFNIHHLNWEFGDAEGNT